MRKQEPDVRSYRILVVEDEGLIAHDIAKRLESLGHSVVGTASTADEAVAAAHTAELVLMDIRIDGERDGIDAAAEIRERYHIPVIFLTAHADRSTLERAKVAAPYGYMVKPLGPATLQASIEMAAYKHAVERQLEESEAWLRTTVFSAGEAILAADKSGKVLLMNPAAAILTGIPADDAIGQSLDKILHLIDAATGQRFGELEALAIVRDTATPLDSRMEVISRDGRHRAVEGTAAPVRTASGTAGVVICLHDVTAQRWQERRLQQWQRTEVAARLAAGVATDYNHLVAVIRSQVGHLLAQFGEYSPARHAIEEIHQAASQADQLTKRLETFGTRQPLRMDLVSVNALLRRLTRLIQSVAAGRLSIEIEPRTDTGRVRADITHLEQAVMTLIMHAVSVTPSGGHLSVETDTIESRPGDTQIAIVMTYSAHED